MPKFYFDFEDDGETIVDEQGEDFSGLDAAQREASVALAEAAKDCRRPNMRLTIIVRDYQGPVVEVSATFETKPIRGREGGPKDA
jgi:hypothetical protein